MEKTLELPTTLPDEIIGRLHATRRKLRTVEVLLGAARAGLAIALAVVVSFILDKALEPPLDLRQPFAIFVFGSAFAVAAWFLIVPWRRRLDDDTVAVLVENAHPELDDVLVSAVQLSRSLERGDAGHTSPALIGSTIARASAATRDLDFAGAIDATPLLPAFFLTATAFTALLAFAGMQSEIARAYWHRVILWEEASYPKPIDLELSIARETALASGDDLNVEVTATRGAKRIEKIVARTVFTTAEGHARPVEERPLLQVGEGKFRKIYQNVTESFEFVIDAGHHVVTPKYSVKVVARPRIEAARFWLHCPEYTGIAPTPRQKPVTEPDLRVPVGTEIEYEALASTALAEARLVFERDAPGVARAEKDEGAHSAAPVVAPGSVDEPGPPPILGGDGKERGRKLAGKFTVTRSTRFRFALRSTEGYDDGKKPVVFSITAVIDHPPEVKIPVPGRTKQATPRGIVNLEIEMKDDYEIAKAELRTKTDSLSYPSAKADGGDHKTDRPGGDVEEHTPFPIEKGTKQTTIKTKIDLAGMALHPGDRVTYRALAWDYDIDVSRREGSSPSYTILVVGPEDMARLLQERLARLKDELIATAKGQKSTRDDAEAAVKSLAPKPKLDQGDKDKLARLEVEQRKVTARLSNVAEELGRIVEEREQNRLGDQRELERTQGLHEGAKDLAERASPLVSRELDDAHKTTDLDEKTRAKLARVPDLMDEVEAKTRWLATSIEKWGDYTEIIREVRDILKEQETITSGTESAIKSSQGGGSPEKK